jgi:hypothetical protein
VRRYEVEEVKEVKEGKSEDAALKGRATNYERCERFLPYTDNSSWISTGGHGMRCPYKVRIPHWVE